MTLLEHKIEMCGETPPDKSLEHDAIMAAMALDDLREIARRHCWRLAVSMDASQGFITLLHKHERKDLHVSA